MTVPHLVRAESQQRIAWIGGSEHHVVFDGAATGGRLAAVRSTMRAGAASPVHVHDRDDETVFLLAGTAVFWAGDQRWELGAGDSVFLPRGVPHSYVFTSDTDMLCVCNPAGMEEFFRIAGWDLTTPQPAGWVVDLARLQAAGEATGQRVLGPPLRPDDAMPPEYRVMH